MVVSYDVIDVILEFVMTEGKIQSVVRYRATSPTKNGKSLSPSSTHWSPIPSDAHEKVIFANS